MLLICDLQTLCFQFSPSTLSCPPLTILSLFFFLLVVYAPSLSPVSSMFVFYFFFVPSFPPSLCCCGSLGEIHFLIQPKHIKCIILCHGGQLEPLQVTQCYTHPFYFIRMPSLAHSLGRSRSCTQDPFHH